MADVPPAEPADEIEIPAPGDAEPEPRKITIPERQEWARQVLALSLVAIFGLEVLGSMLALWFCAVKLQDLKETLILILGPTVALVGSATGFYFGSRERADPPPSSPPI